MRGRKSLPTVIKEMRGTQRAGRINKKEPTYKQAGLSPPQHLGGEAAKHWHQICPDLVASGVMRIIDVSALAMYCESYARWIEASGEVKKQGMIIAAPSGYPVQNPYLSIANKAYEHMLKTMTEFGMTPSSRSKVAHDKPEKEDPADEFFDRTH